MHLYQEQIKRSHSIYIVIIQIDTTTVQQRQIIYNPSDKEFSNMHGY